MLIDDQTKSTALQPCKDTKAHQGDAAHILRTAELDEFFF